VNKSRLYYNRKSRKAYWW